MALGNADRAVEFFTRARSIYESQPSLNPDSQQDLSFLVLATNGAPFLKSNAISKLSIRELADSGLGTLRNTISAQSESLAAAEKAYGMNDPRILTSLEILAHLYLTTGQINEARELVDRGFAIRAQNGHAEPSEDRGLYDLRSSAASSGRGNSRCDPPIDSIR